MTTLIILYINTLTSFTLFGRSTLEYVTEGILPPSCMMWMMNDDGETPTHAIIPYLTSKQPNLYPWNTTNGEVVDSTNGPFSFRMYLYTRPLSDRACNFRLSSDDERRLVNLCSVSIVILGIVSTLAIGSAGESRINGKLWETSSLLSFGFTEGNRES